MSLIESIASEPFHESLSAAGGGLQSSFSSDSSSAMSRLAKRTDQVMPFYAVEIFKQASALNAQGRDIISLGIGEPDFTAPAQVVETLHRATEAGLSGYTSPAGISALREAIAHYYLEHFGANVDASR